MTTEPKLASVLAADIGNSNVTIGVVRGDQAYAPKTVPLASLEQVLPAALRDMWDATTAPRRLAASSVNPETLARFTAIAEEAIDEPTVVVGQNTPLPMETELPEPGRIGMDRLCCAAAAFARLAQACVVVDVGTAVTIDYVDGEGLFMGGSILPGLRLQAASLAGQTALLPEVDMTEPDWVLGRNTAEAIIGGVIYGLRGAVREIIERYATELGTWPTVIYTGGDAKLIGGDLAIAQAIVPELCLLGVARAFYLSLLEGEDE